jgi:LCP family protein required for cell wall assembly
MAFAPGLPNTDGALIIPSAMTKMRPTRSHDARRRTSIWPSLLLGSLLALFFIAFLYAGYLFLQWGQSLTAEVPNLPALALPKLVHAGRSSASAGQDGAADAAAQDNNGPSSAAPAASDRVTVVLMGVDNRPDEPVARTDTIIILSLNPKTHAAGMLSVPRDMLVHSSAMNRDVKINTVHVLGEINKYPGGGPALLRETLAEALGYPMNYYVRVNFDGFRQIIDLLGGIDIDVPQDIRDDTFPNENYGYDPLFIPAGRQHMDGTLALKYARTRHADDDYGRERRQQQIIMAVKDKVMQPGELPALLPRLPALMLALTKVVQTDIPVDRAISLARNLDQVDLNNPARVVIDKSMGEEKNDPRLGFVMVPDVNKLRAAADAILADAPPGQQPGDTASVRILVLNGSEQAGLAALTADALTKDGYTVAGVDNADRSDYAESWLVTHGNAGTRVQSQLAQRLHIPADHIRADAPIADADVTIILGADQTTGASFDTSPTAGQ